jgi:LEA14-like dessication related protein
MKRTLLAAVTGAALLLLTGCVSLDPPQITYLDSDITPVSFQEVKVSSHFRASNKNLIGLNGWVDYNLQVNSKDFSAGKSSWIDVPASGQSTFTIESRVDVIKAFGVMADLASAVAAGTKTIPFNIKGTFKSNVAGLQLEAPVSASGDLPLPNIPAGTDLEKLIKRIIR